MTPIEPTSRGRASDPITDEVRTFVQRFIQSVEHLEVLLLMYRAPRGTPWTAQSVARELRADETSIASRLRDHCHAGLIAEDASDGVEPMIAYQTSDDEGLHRLVGDLSTAYRERRYRVIDMIFSKPIDKLRTFADAFKYRKDS